MSLQRKVARRRRALQWFVDDPAEALFRKRPSTRLCRLMQREGLLDAEPVGQFGFARWQVTPLGLAVLKPSVTPC